MEGDHDIVQVRLFLRISIHALRVEGDASLSRQIYESKNFYPRPPGGGRQLFPLNSLEPFIISIHALRVEGDAGRITGAANSGISIHALRVEGDGYCAVEHLFSIFNFYPRPPGGGRLTISFSSSATSNFYPRPPGGGRLSDAVGIVRGQTGFLSTPSGWRATKIKQRVTNEVIFLSTPSGWRATRHPFVKRFKRSCISIHALRVEGDQTHICSNSNICISIHALRVEGDAIGYCLPSVYSVFLSTPSGWRATSPNPVSSLTVPISIHALRVEGDRLRRACSSAGRHFYPRPPGGGRPCAAL